MKQAIKEPDKHMSELIKTTSRIKQSWKNLSKLDQIIAWQNLPEQKQELLLDILKPARNKKPNGGEQYER